jgi:glycosyltransferase involved in cell wall biosynthesis
LSPAPAEEAIAFADPPAPTAPIRLLVVAEGWTATPQIAFVEGLKAARAAGTASVTAVTEPGLDALRERAGEGGVQAFLEELFDRVRPTTLVLCRYAGPDGDRLLALARERGVPVLYHLDDDLFETPIAAGAATYARYRHPRRLHRLYRLVEAADAVLAATPALAQRIRELCNVTSITVSDPYLGAAVTDRPPAARPDGEVRIGYMASSTHVFDLELIAPALKAVLERRPQASLHFFGGIAKTRLARSFAERATFTPRVDGSYADFRARLATLGWDIGLAPLRPSAFNGCKAVSKWAEYAEAGAAVVASAGSAYDALASDGAVRLCDPDDWERTLDELTADAGLRRTVAGNARRLIAERYGWDRLERRLTGFLQSL